MGSQKSTILAGLILIIVVIAGCTRRNPLPDISDIKLDHVSIHRYEQDLFKISKAHIGNGLDSLHGRYSVFIGDNYRDTLNIVRIFEYLSDPMIQELKQKTDEVFPDLNDLEEGLTQAFRYWKYFFPSDTMPDVYSYISGLYYEAPVEYFGGNLIISLDLFLGSDFEPYRAIGLPYYSTRRMTPDFIVPECMRQIGISHFPDQIQTRTLLDQMVMHGKLLYFLESVLPAYPDTLLTGFTPAQESWCVENQGSIWTMLLEDQLLFSSDPFVVNKFMLDGPFTSGLPKESPAMLGRWIGWQIVRAYMENNPATTLPILFSMQDNQLILSESHYKPAR